MSKLIIQALQKEVQDLRKQLRLADAYIARRDATCDRDHLHADVMDAGLSRVQRHYREAHSWIDDEGQEVIWKAKAAEEPRWTWIDGPNRERQASEEEALRAWLAARSSAAPVEPVEARQPSTPAPQDLTGPVTGAMLREETGTPETREAAQEWARRVWDALHRARPVRDSDDPG